MAPGKDSSASMSSYDASLSELATQQDQSLQAIPAKAPDALRHDIVHSFNKTNGGLNINVGEAEKWGLSDTAIETTLKDALKRNTFQNYLDGFVAKKLRTFRQSNAVPEKLFLADVIAGFRGSEHGFEITDQHMQRWQFSDDKLNNVARERFDKFDKEVALQAQQKNQKALKAYIRKHFSSFENIYSLEKSYFSDLTLDEFFKQPQHHISVEMLVDHFNKNEHPLSVSKDDVTTLGFQQDKINTLILKLREQFLKKLMLKREPTLVPTQSTTGNVST